MISTLKVKCQWLYVICRQNGYIALTSAIIITILLLAITVSLGFSGFFTRFNILDSESKERSLALAEACIDKAMLNIAQNLLYNPINETVAIESDQCKIVSVTASGNQRTIKTQAVVNKSYTNLKIVINADTFSIISWEECLTGSCF